MHPDDERTTPLSTAETHVSWLFFTPDRAFKLLKPIATGFLDHRDVDRRVAAVTAELELNRRLAPDVYLGTADLVEHDRLSDRMLIMRRLPSDRRLSGLVDDDRFLDHLRRVAHLIAGFHGGLPAIDRPVPMATAAGLTELWTSSFDEIEPAVGTLIDEAEFGVVRRASLAYLEHSERLLDRRRREGYVRDGHGDLIADDIFMLDDGPRVLDCLAFDADYRVSDVLADIAFLVMDVERLAGPAAARRLMRWYCDFSGERHPPSLAHHYVAYRAHVRAKVAVLRHRQGDRSAAESAAAFHRQAADHLHRARPRIALIGGGPGTGKTTIANTLAEQLEWSVIDTDTLRKDLHGIDHDDHDVARHPELYSAASTARTYERLIEQAAMLLAGGRSVILDATWSDAARRDQARSMAALHGAEVVEFECHVDPLVARRRIEARLADGTDASDATPLLVDAAERDPWPEARRLDTTIAVADLHAEALAVISGRPQPAAPVEAWLPADPFGTAATGADPDLIDEGAET